MVCSCEALYSSVVLSLEISAKLGIFCNSQGWVSPWFEFLGWLWGCVTMVCGAGKGRRGLLDVQLNLGTFLGMGVCESHGDLGRRDGSTKKNNLFLFRLTDP